MTKLVRFDWAIKYLLRNKANFDILEGFLSELLKRDIHIESILESESNKVTADDKQNRVDLLVQADREEQIIIEIQCLRQWDYFSRMLYATSKTVTENLYEGDSYSKVAKVIAVHIVFFDLGIGKDYLYKGTTSFHGLHFHDTLTLSKEEQKLYLHANTPADIFPEYYLIKVDQFRESIQDKLDEWIYFLKNATIQPEFQAKGIQEAASKLDILRLDEKDRRAYERFREELSYESSMTEVPYDLGKIDGIAIGEANKHKAIQEAIAIGEANKAKAVEETTLNLAKMLIQSGVTLETVSHATKLPLKTLQGLLKQLKKD